MLSALLVATVAASAAWVYLDATKHKIGKIPGAKGLFNMSAGAWAIVTLLLWIIGFPSYLLKRKSLAERANSYPVEVGGRGIKTAILAVVGGLWFLAAAANTLTTQGNVADDSNKIDKRSWFEKAASTISSSEWTLNTISSDMDGEVLTATRVYPFPDRDTQFQIEITCQPGKKLTLGDMVAGAAGSLSSLSPVSMKIKSLVGDIANPADTSALVSEIHVNPADGTTFHYPVARVKHGEIIISGPMVFMSLLMGDYSNEVIYQGVDSLGKDMPILMELKNGMGTFELNIDHSSEVEQVLAACGKDKESLTKVEMERQREQALSVVLGELKRSCKYFGYASEYDSEFVKKKLVDLSISPDAVPEVEMDCEKSAPEEFASFNEEIKKSYEFHRNQEYRLKEAGLHNALEWGRIPAQGLCTFDEYIAHIRTIENGYMGLEIMLPECEIWKRTTSTRPKSEAAENSSEYSEPFSSQEIVRMGSAAADGQPNVGRSSGSGKAAGTLETNPSFDCAKASTSVEKEICADEILSGLDREMGEKYAALLRMGIGGDVLKATQRMWTNTRNSCTDRACLALAYMNRVRELDDFAASKR